MRYKVKWISSTHADNVQDALNAEPGYEFDQFIELSTGGALIIFWKNPDVMTLDDLARPYSAPIPICKDCGKPKHHPHQDPSSICWCDYVELGDY